MKDILFINVAGYFATGASAVVDLLKEFDNTYECDSEIRFIKDPYGIRNMEDALVNRWDMINSTAAIMDFVDACRIWGRSVIARNPFAKFGLSYERTLNPNFFKLVDEYVMQISRYTYRQNYYYNSMKKSYFRYATDRVRQIIDYKSKGRLPISNSDIRDCFFAKPTQEEFNVATQNFIEKVVETCLPDSVKGNMILDQAVSPNDTQVIHRYFKKAKLILVDRDPRDAYMVMVEIGKHRCEKDVVSAEAGRRYAMLYRAMHEGVTDDKDILYVRFEDLILDYNVTVKKIVDFLGWSMENHITPGKYLRTEVSAKNIGLWKKYYGKYRDAVDAIAEELPEYCYTGENK